MTTWYVKSGSGVAEFQLSHAYTVGNRIVPRRSQTGGWTPWARGWVWECTTAGTSAAADPTWPSPPITQDSTTVTSGGATFTARRPGFSSGTTMNWSFATPYLDYVANTSSGFGGATTFVLVSNNHNESVAENVTIDFNGLSYDFGNILCVDDSASPPTSLATGATVAYNSLTLDHWAHIYGIHFKTLVGGLTEYASSEQLCEKCLFEIANATAGSRLSLNNSLGHVRWIDCDVKFGNAAQLLLVWYGTGIFEWIGGSILSGSAAITQLFGGNVGAPNTVVSGVDLSNAAQNMNVVAVSGSDSGAFRIALRGCKMPAGWTGAPGSAALWQKEIIDLYGCDTGAAVPMRWRQTFVGDIKHETTLIRTGGASDGTTGISWKCATSTSASFAQPLYSDWVDVWNDTVGSQVTLTIELLHDSAADLTDVEAWGEVLMYGTSGSTQLARVASRPRTLWNAASALAASTETWNTGSMANPNKQKITLQFTPQVAGPILARVAVAKASKTLYVCPKINVQ